MKFIRMGCVFQSVSWYTAVTQLVLLCAIMFIGPPGIYVSSDGLEYVSSNFCTKPALAALFIVSTLPTWVILTCSVALEPNKHKQRALLFLMALPMSTGLGIVFFSLCERRWEHYVYVNTFVISVGCVHLAIALTADHVEFYQAYYMLLSATTVCSIFFILFASISTGPGYVRDFAVTMEYIAVTGFVLLNGLSADRLREHIRIVF
jgi:hypothetical protein